MVDFFGVGVSSRHHGKISNQKVEMLWDLNEEILSKVQAKFISPTLYQPNLLSVGIPRFQSFP